MNVFHKEHHQQQQQGELSSNDVESLIWLLSEDNNPPVSKPESVVIPAKVSNDYVVVRRLLNDTSHLNKSKKRKAAVAPATKEKAPEKKSKATNALNAPTPIQKIEKIDSFVLSANKYMNYYVASRNADSVTLAECMKNICAPDCQAEIFGKSMNTLDFTFLNLIPLDRWILSVASMQMLSPDGLMTISNVHHLHSDWNYPPPSLQTTKSIDSINTPTSTFSSSSKTPQDTEQLQITIPPASFLYSQRDDEIAFIAELDSIGTLIYEKNSVAIADENGDRPSIISLLKQQQQQPLKPLPSEAIQAYHIRAFLIFRRRFGEKVHKIEYFYEFL